MVSSVIKGHVLHLLLLQKKAPGVLGGGLRCLARTRISRRLLKRYYVTFCYLNKMTNNLLEISVYFKSIFHSFKKSRRVWINLEGEVGEEKILATGRS